MKMQVIMMNLTKKYVRRASRLVFKATEKPSKSKVLQHVVDAAVRVANHNTNFEGTVNLQCTQYEEIKKVAEATTKFEGLPEVIESQANDIEDLKASINIIQDHVSSHTLWLNETDKEMANIPQIKDKQDTMQVADLHELIVSTLQGDDAKKGERGE